MNICLIRFGAVVGSEGGTEKVLCNMANEFVNREHNITIIFELSDKVNFVNLNDTGKEIKGCVLLRVKRELLKAVGKLDRTEKDKIFIESRYDNDYIKNRFNKIISDINPDIIIAYDYLSVLFLKYLMKNNLPTIAMLHHDPIVYFNNDYSKVQINAFNKVDCIQILIENRLNLVKKYCPKVRIEYISNVVPVVKYEKKNKTYHKIINVAALVKDRKQQHIVIEAFNKIKNDVRGWMVEFMGGTKTSKAKAYKEEMLSYIKENALENNIYFSGISSDVESKLKEADIFAFPSNSEAFGFALTEAMAAGLPAIGFRSCPAVNEIIIDGYNGFLCDDGIDDFAEKMKILMQNEELRKQMGQNAKESMKKFAPEKIWNQWENLIKEIIKTKDEQIPPQLNFSFIITNKRTYNVNCA